MQRKKIRVSDLKSPKEVVEKYKKKYSKLYEKLKNS